MARRCFSIFGFYVLVLGTYLVPCQAQFSTDLRSRDVLRTPQFPASGLGSLQGIISNSLNKQGNRQWLSGNTFLTSNPLQARGTSYRKQYSSRGKRETNEDSYFHEFFPLLAAADGQRRVKRQAPGFQMWDFHPSSFVRRRLDQANGQNNRQIEEPKMMLKSSTELSNERKSKSKQTEILADRPLQNNTKNVLPMELKLKPASVNIQLPFAHFNAILEQHNMPLEPQAVHFVPGAMETAIKNSDQTKIQQNPKNNFQRDQKGAGTTVEKYHLQTQSNKNADVSGTRVLPTPRYTSNVLQPQAKPETKLDFTAAALVSGEAGVAKQHKSGNKTQLPDTRFRRPTDTAGLSKHSNAKESRGIISSNDIVLDIKQLSDLIDRTTRILLRNKGHPDTNQLNERTKSKFYSAQSVANDSPSQMHHTPKTNKSSLRATDTAAKNQNQFKKEILNVQEKAAQFTEPDYQQMLSKSLLMPTSAPVPLPQNNQMFQKHTDMHTREIVKTASVPNIRAKTVRQNHQLLPSNRNDQFELTKTNNLKQMINTQDTPSKEPVFVMQNQKRVLDTQKRLLQDPVPFKEQQQMRTARNNPTTTSEPLFLQQSITVQTKAGQSMASLQQNQKSFNQLILNDLTLLQPQIGAPVQNREDIRGNTHVLSVNARIGQTHLTSPEPHQQMSNDLLVSVKTNYNKEQNQRVHDQMPKARSQLPQKPARNSQDLNLIEQQLSSATGLMRQPKRPLANIFKEHTPIQQQSPLSTQKQNVQMSLQQLIGTDAQAPVSSQLQQDMRQQHFFSAQTLPAQEQITFKQNQQFNKQTVFGTQTIPGQDPISLQKNTSLASIHEADPKTYPWEDRVSLKQYQQNNEPNILGTQIVPDNFQTAMQQEEKLNKQQVFRPQTTTVQDQSPVLHDQKLNKQTFMNMPMLPRHNPLILPQKSNLSRQFATQSLLEKDLLFLLKDQRVPQNQMLDTQTLPGQNNMLLQQDLKPDKQGIFDMHVVHRQEQLPLQQDSQLSQQRTFDKEIQPMQTLLSVPEIQSQKLGVSNLQPRHYPMPAYQDQKLPQQSPQQIQTSRRQPSNTSTHTKQRQRTEQEMLNIQNQIGKSRELPFTKQLLNIQNDHANTSVSGSQNQEQYLSQAAEVVSQKAHDLTSLQNKINQNQGASVQKQQQGKNEMENSRIISSQMNMAKSQNWQQLPRQQGSANFNKTSEKHATSTPMHFQKSIKNSHSRRFEPIHKSHQGIRLQPSNYRTMQGQNFIREQSSQTPITKTPLGKKLLNKTSSNRNKGRKLGQPNNENRASLKGRGIPLPIDRQIHPVSGRVTSKKQTPTENVSKEGLRTTSFTKGIQKNRGNNDYITRPANKVKQISVPSYSSQNKQMDYAQDNINAPANTIIDNPLEPKSLWNPSRDSHAGQPVASNWGKPTRKIKTGPSMARNITSGRRNGAESVQPRLRTGVRGSVKGGKYVKNWFNPRQFDSQNVQNDQINSVSYDQSPSNESFNNESFRMQNIPENTKFSNVYEKSTETKGNSWNRSSNQDKTNRKPAPDGQKTLQNKKEGRRKPGRNPKHVNRLRGRSGRRPGNIVSSDDFKSLPRNDRNSTLTTATPRSQAQKRHSDRRRNKPAARKPSKNKVSPAQRSARIDSTTGAYLTTQHTNFGVDNSGEVVFYHGVLTTISPTTARNSTTRSTTPTMDTWNRPNNSASSALLNASYSWNGNTENIKNLSQSSGSDIKRNKTISITKKVQRTQNASKESHAPVPINFNVFLGIPTTERPKTKHSNTADMLRLLNALSVLRGNLAPPTTLLPPVKIVFQLERDRKPGKLRCRCFPKSDGCPSELKEEPLADMCDVRVSIPCCEDG